MWMERSRDTQGHHRDQNFTGPSNCCAPALLVGCPWSAPVIRQLWPQRSAVLGTCLVVAPITASTWPPGLKQPSTYVKAFLNPSVCQVSPPDPCFKCLTPLQDDILDVASSTSGKLFSKSLHVECPGSMGPGIFTKISPPAWEIITLARIAR